MRITFLRTYPKPQKGYSRFFNKKIPTGFISYPAGILSKFQQITKANNIIFRSLDALATNVQYIGSQYR